MIAWSRRDSVTLEITFNREHEVDEFKGMMLRIKISWKVE